MNRPGRWMALATAAVCAVAGRAGAQDMRVVEVPAAAGAMAAELSVHDETVVLSWLEAHGKRRADRTHALRFAKLEGATWTAPRTVVEGAGFFANWADFPSVVAGADGQMLAHWLVRSGAGTYAYDAVLARSTDGGESWKQLGKLHADNTETEHGFVSIVPHDGGFAAVWLDGRAMADGGAMALRSATIRDEPADKVVVDADVCTCCQTDLVRSRHGLVAVYRDHAAEEVRDISVVRRTAAGWTKPRSVHDDGWRIGGCPVNGPAIAADRDLLAVAWFTAVPTPRVNVAFSTNGGASFGSPVAVDTDDPVGRVDVVCAAGGAIVSWLARDDDTGAVRLRHVSPAGATGDPIGLGQTAAARASGFPRMVRRGDALIVVWRDTAEPPRLRSALVPLAAVPAAETR